MWFEGTIQEALNRSKNDCMLLIIFVQGSNESSLKMKSQFDNSIIIKNKLENVILLKLEEGTVNAKMFQQIYPITEIPSTYLISSDGKALELISGSIDHDNLVEKIDIAIVKQNEKVKSTVNKDENKAQTSSNQNNQTNLLSNKDKQKRAQELLEEIRIKKTKEKEENLREAEKIRIKMSKEIQKAKELQRQKEIENLIVERKREQLEAKLAKEKILARIREDHEERKHKINEKLVADNKFSDLKFSEPQITSEDVRLQFRLPNSNVLRNNFKINDSLKTVSKYIEDNSEFRNFTLATAFPKKKFESEDLDKTLIDLKLAPSASLMVIMNNNPKIYKKVDENL